MVCYWFANWFETSVVALCCLGYKSPMKLSDAILALRDALPDLAPELGDRLPAERALAAKVGCGRSTLRAALAKLEAEGEVWRHVGQGTFRGTRPHTHPIRDRLLIEGATPQDLMAARMVLEPAVAAAAAQAASETDVHFLRDRVAQGRQGRDRAACEQADDAFHLGIAQVAGNAVLVGMMRYLSGARRRATWQRAWDRVYRRLGVSEFQTEHSTQHDHIVDAIAAGDADGAANAMRAHLETIQSAMTPRDS